MEKPTLTREIIRCLKRDIVRELYPFILSGLARADIFNYIEVFYNRARRGRHLSSTSPEAFKIPHCEDRKYLLWWGHSRTIPGGSGTDQG